jgi:hypothetical protein
LDELRYSFLTTYKRLHFLIRIFHINPEDTKVPFNIVIRDAFESQFTPRQSLFSEVKTFRWKTIK